jgi:hypothetical protein
MVRGPGGDTLSYPHTRVWIMHVHLQFEKRRLINMKYNIKSQTFHKSILPRSSVVPLNWELIKHISRKYGNTQHYYIWRYKILINNKESSNLCLDSTWIVSIFSSVSSFILQSQIVDIFRTNKQKKRYDFTIRMLYPHKRYIILLPW